MSKKTGEVETLAKLKAKVIEVTTRLRGQEEPEKEKKTEYSEFAKSLLSVWEKADFGCQSPHVAQILHILVKDKTGEDVEFTRPQASPADVVRGATVVKYVALVPLTNTNGHSYPKKLPMIISNEAGRIGIKWGGGEGNHLGGKMRYATDEEINALFESFEGEDEGEVVGYF